MKTAIDTPMNSGFRRMSILILATGIFTLLAAGCGGAKNHPPPAKNRW